MFFGFFTQYFILRPVPLFSCHTNSIPNSKLGLLKLSQKYNFSISIHSTIQNLPCYTFIIKMLLTFIIVNMWLYWEIVLCISKIFLSSTEYWFIQTNIVLDGLVALHVFNTKALPRLEISVNYPGMKLRTTCMQCMCSTTEVRPFGMMWYLCLS